MKRRVFVKTSEFIGQTSIRSTVDRWEWTRREGLIVVFKDGFRMRSEYRTLPEFLQAVKKGHEGPVVERKDA